MRLLARRLGVEGHALRALEVVQPVRRRDRLDNEHLRLLLAFTLDEKSNCVDIGCNHGVVLADIVRIAPSGQHYAFEPLPGLAADLRVRFPDVDVRQVALSDRPGTATFAHVLGADGRSGLHDRNLGDMHDVRHIDVEIGRLDDMLPRDYAPSFVKIDVEGAELQVLEGARATLSTHHPVLWFEHGHLQSGFYGTTSNNVWDLLCGDLGYRIFDSDGAGPYTRTAFDALAGVPMWSFAAR